MGRPAKPVGLHIAEGNPNRLTREQLQQRKEAEIKLGKADLDKLRPPAFVKSDVIALAHWKQALKEYKEAAKQGAELLTSSDVGLLAMYCKSYSEYEYLLGQYQRIKDIEIDADIFEEYFAGKEQAIELELEVKTELKAMRYLSQLASLEGALKIETAINKKMDMLLKMQDRLFLNPSSKVKNVPKPKKDDKPQSKFAKFGANRSG
ncbi:P27 family phage terminase small subunit [Paenibacillus macerans]|uniref:P27 family phage terminase small subunit n=1 Tax=Paenibacillus macerans TaxID=44252 RepID=UPI003D320884